jgi:hypothetical protein
MVKFLEPLIDNKNNILPSKTSIKNMSDAYFKLELSCALISAFRPE